MELLPLVCIYILAWSARGDQTDPPVTEINVMEGDDVVLPCSFGAMDITNKAFDWKKQNVADDKKEVFLYESGNMYGPTREGQAKQFKGRVFHFPDQLTSGNASIQIKPTNVDDSGTYICIKATTPPTILYTVHLTVGQDVYKINVTEDDAVVLPCSFGNMDIKKETFHWKKQNVANDKREEVFWYDNGTMYDPKHDDQAKHFKGRVFHFPDQLTSGNASIQIKHTKVDDSGTYICIKATKPSKTLSRVQLHVAGVLKDRTGGNVTGAAKKPSVTILKQTKDRALLQCEVRGASPKPNVTWQDNAGNILPAEEPQITERGNRYDIILNTTVTKTDLYRCVATQEEINHQLNRTIHVHVDGTTTLEALEGSDIILPCSPSTKKDMVSGLFDWKKDDGVEVFFYDAGNHYNNGRPGQNERFKGRVSHFPDQLKVGKASIVIHNTKVEDSGSYRCIFPHLQPPEEKIITLVVHDLKDRKGENTSGSSTGWIVAFAVVTIILCVLGGLFVLVKKGLIKLQCNKAGSQEPTSPSLDSVPDQQPLKG